MNEIRGGFAWTRLLQIRLSSCVLFIKGPSYSASFCLLPNTHHCNYKHCPATSCSFSCGLCLTRAAYSPASYHSGLGSIHVQVMYSLRNWRGFLRALLFPLPIYIQATATTIFTSWEVAGSRPNDVKWDFSVDLILRAALCHGFTQPRTEISIRNRTIMFIGSRARPVRRADKFTAICEPIV
jgi:hypothetical protein